MASVSCSVRKLTWDISICDTCKINVKKRIAEEKILILDQVQRTRLALQYEHTQTFWKDRKIDPGVEYLVESLSGCSYNL